MSANTVSSTNTRAADEMGRKSAIFEYVTDPERGNEHVVWFCWRRGRKYFAQDVPESELKYVRRQLGLEAWWRRLFFYTVVGVKPVKIVFIDGERQKERYFEVNCVPIDYASTREELLEKARTLESHIELNDSTACFLDANGESGCTHPCRNVAFERVTRNPYCQYKALCHVRTAADEALWTRPELDRRWRNGFGKGDVNFLRTAGFSHPYNDFARSKFHDAKNSYGASYNAQLLERGWELRRLLYFSIAMIIFDCCITGIVLCAGQRDAAFAVGSYMVEAEAIFISIVSVLSVLLR